VKPPGDVRVKIVRETLTVDADSDFTIYCLLRELERWRDRNNGNYPQTWYLQVDGGSENANKYVLAALEFLVIKRMVQTIVLTRLHVGHTHEDIDACFENIAVYFQRNIIQTPQDYMKQMEAAFNGSSNSKLKCSVEDFCCCS
jgi:hypothetical protein